jgi:hypothetical protein
MFAKRLLWLVLVLFAATGLRIPTAFADSVAAQLSTPRGSAIGNGLTGNSSAFYLYSNMKTPFVVGPNDSTSISQISSTGVRTTIADPIPVAEGTLLDFGAKTYPDVAGHKLVAKNMIPKPDQPSGFQVGTDFSSMGAIVGNTFLVFSVFSSGAVSQGNFPKFEAGARTQNGATGSAASITYDPGQLAAPSLGYYPLNHIDSSGVRQDAYLFDATLSRDNPNGFAAVEFMALDSRFGPTYPSNLGDPSNNLWTLTIIADKPAHSVSDLTIMFQINPLATKAGGGTEDILTDASGNPLSDGSVISRVLGALTVIDGVATLAPVDLFPDGTQYHVDRTITYGVAAGAALTTAVPEPASAWLLGLGALGLLVCATRRGKRNRGETEVGVEWH